MRIYDFVVKDNKNQDVSLKEYEGKALLIINTATHCGFTPQYDGLEALYQKYKEQGLEVLDFPCNQFGRQAKEDDEGINTFCTLRFNTKFKRFKKICVNDLTDKDFEEGFTEVEPLYKFLKEETNTKKISWNFNKFLIDRSGNVIAHFGSMKTPKSLEKEIEKLL